jgi:hypothetical protein
MSDQFFYLQLNFIPKTGSRTARVTGQHQVAVEVSRDLVRSQRSMLLNENPREKAIALDLARSAALRAFSTFAEGIALPYDEDAIWCEDRLAVMNERPCDHEENGTRAWRMAQNSNARGFCEI